MGKYQSFKELAANEKEGLDYHVRTACGNTNIAVMAIHGGGIEPGTTEIAEAIAGDRHSFYTFSGLKPTGNAVLHITSRRFDEPRGLEVARNASVIISIHGSMDSRLVIYLGGRNIPIKNQIRQSLQKAGFQVGESAKFPGLSPMNICNRCHFKAGVQLEISYGLRCRMFQSLKRHHREKTTEIFRCFVDTLKKSIDSIKIKC